MQQQQSMCIVTLLLFYCCVLLHCVVFVLESNWTWAAGNKCATVTLLLYTIRETWPKLNISFPGSAVPLNSLSPSSTSHCWMPEVESLKWHCCRWVDKREQVRILSQEEHRMKWKMNWLTYHIHSPLVDCCITLILCSVAGWLLYLFNVCVVRFGGCFGIATVLALCCNSCCNCSQG